MFRFGLTRADLERITWRTGVHASEWTDTDVVPEHVLEILRVGAPGIERQFPGGRRVALRFDGHDRACTWLGPAGCTLDVDTRPRTCALYPYWQVDGVVTGVVSHPGRCRVLREGGLDVTHLERVAVLAEAELVANQVSETARVSGYQ